MRVNKALLWVAVPAVALAACGGGGEEGNKTKARAQNLAPGQYEVTAEVTNFRKADEGTPKIEAEVGSRTTRSVCVTDGAQLPPELFIEEGYSCQAAGDAFARGGSINITYRCTRPDLSGAIGTNVSGTFEAESFEAQRTLSTQLSTDGDVVIASNLTGRRTGDCSAAPAGNSAGNSK